MESVEYEPAWSLGANCGNNDINAVAYMIDQCNDFGMDPIEIGQRAVDVHGSQRAGLHQRRRQARLGRHRAAWSKLTEQIAMRQGVGDKLAEGTSACVQRTSAIPKSAMTVKGQAIPAYDPRGLKGMGIAYATSNRGACHLRAYTPAAELGVMPFGSLKVDPLAWKGKGELTKIFQDVHAVSDSLRSVQVLGLCRRACRSTPNSSTP